MQHVQIKSYVDDFWYTALSLVKLQNTFSWGVALTSKQLFFDVLYFYIHFVCFVCLFCMYVRFVCFVCFNFESANSWKLYLVNHSDGSIFASNPLHDCVQKIFAISFHLSAKSQKVWIHTKLTKHTKQTYKTYKTNIQNIHTNLTNKFSK